MSISKALPTQQKWHTATYIMLYVVAIAKLVVMIWSTNRGFDIGDEGLYMLSLNDPERYSVLAHGHLLNSILPFEHFTITISRTISMVLELAGGIVFSWGLFRWLKAKVKGKVNFWQVSGLVLLGSFHSLFARCVSYNDIIYFLGLSSAGIFLISLTIKVNWQRISLWMISFTLITFCAIFKTPVPISLGFLLLVIILLTSHADRLQQLMLGVSSLLVGAVITVGVYTLLYNGSSWLNVITDVQRTADLLNYRPIDLILMYLIYDGVPNAIFIGIGIAMFTFTKHMLSSNTQLAKLKIMLVSGIVTIAVGIIAINQLQVLLIPEERIAYPYLWILMGTMLMLAYYLYRSSEKAPTDTWAILLLLFALPVGLIGGTNGFITETLFTFWMPWFGIVATITIVLKTSDNFATRYPVVSLMLVVSVCSLFVQTKMLHPFGVPQDEDLFTQIVPYNGTDDLLLDKTSHEYFLSASALVDEHYDQPDPAILAMNYTPGLVYLLNGYSPGAPFYMFHQDFTIYNCNKIAIAAYDSIRPIIIYRTSTQPEVLQCIADAEWNFPEGYITYSIADPYSNIHESDETTNGKLYLAFPQ